MKHCIHIAAACLALAGCFENHSRPADALTVTSLDALAATNRAEVVRLLLRGSQKPVGDDELKGLSASALKQLDLSELGLAKVPESVWSFKGLGSLWLARNKLAEIPSGIAQLPALTYLNLDGNMLAAAPEALSRVVSLRWLRLNENKLRELPASLAALKDMRRIYLQRNLFTSVPSVIQEWTELESLALDDNAITEVPDWLGAKMTKLKFLSLKGNPVTRLPSDLSGLRRLAMLNLADCRISSEETERIRSLLGDKVAIVY